MDISALNFTRNWFDENLRETLDRVKTGDPIKWFAKSLTIPAIAVVKAWSSYSGFGWLFVTPSGEQQLSLGVARDWQWGHSEEVLHMETQMRRLRADGLPEDVQIVGGQAFDSGSRWDFWPTVYTALPIVQVFQNSETSTLRVVLPMSRDVSEETYQSQLQPIWRALFAAHPQEMTELDTPYDISSHPSRHNWQRLVGKAADDLKNGALHKVVLARELDLRYHRPVSLARVIENLQFQNPEATVFAIRHHGSTFLGATPEILATVQRDHVETMSLAGSTPRGLTPEEDRALADAMKSDTKMIHEHALVRDHVQHALETVCENVSMPITPDLKRLPSVQHLLTQFRGQLRDQATIWSVIAAMHPTPAVAGYPVGDAVSYIGTHEPFKRGWYAGSLGWANLAGDGQWLVALRSGLFESHQVRLYAGCGIMADSNPELELKESDWKFNTMLSALELEGEPEP